jgi:hypothetical protein
MDIHPKKLWMEIHPLPDWLIRSYTREYCKPARIKSKFFDLLTFSGGKVHNTME